ncbi:MAG: methyl-accepting chemotaxis protein [Nostocaceae cyanobacterium]|nr:methyl-accepting chemotaxis protein [Nostocaceae cyanobacterium]
MVQRIKDDTSKNLDVQSHPAIISSQQLDTDRSASETPSNGVTTQPWKNPQSIKNNSLASAWQKLSLGTKATVLAMALGTLPILGIGALAYSLADHSVRQQISQNQEAQAVGLADKVNRFMLERYGDLEAMSKLVIITNPRIRETATKAEKQAVLKGFIDAYKTYESIAVFDVEGNLLLDAQGEPIPNQKQEAYFQEVLKNNRPVISQPVPGKTTKDYIVYFAAPVKDTVTGQTVSIVRTIMPVKAIKDAVQNYEDSGYEYHLIDASGKFFLAAEENQIGREATADFPGLEQQQTAKKQTSFVTTDQLDNAEQLVSYVPSRTIPGLPNLNWDVIVATDTAKAFATQRQLLLTLALGTGLSALAVGLIAAWLAKRATQPVLTASSAVEELGKGKLDTRIRVTGEDELATLGANINHMAQQLQVLVKEQELDAERARQFADITLRVRSSLKKEDIVNTAVKEVRQALKTDRVLIYGFNNETEWDGTVLAESVAPGLPKMIEGKFDDPCFKDRHVDMYKNGRVRAITNIYEEPTLSNAACYIKMLGQYEVKGNLIAPIKQGEQLAGLLVAHHCESPRSWQAAEIDLFKQVAIQIGFALDQAQLLEVVDTARANAEKISVEQRQQKEQLQLQLLELLNDVEGASRGDLTVRADVTAGEIGTVADFFNSIVESLRGIVTQVKTAATQVNAAIGSNQGAIAQLADEALQQADEINLTLNSVDNMTHSILAVAESAQKAAVVANSASRTAEESGSAMDLTVQNILKLRETVGETTKKVKRLGESSQQISRVVSLINQIALQTNLLAINAGIEAARAGEEGQGFAVVAEEVGELAARSAAATQEIEQIVENIQRETSEVVRAMETGTTQVVEGTKLVEDAKQSLGQILHVSREIDALVQSISQATESQVETSQSVTKLMKQIAAVSERTSDSSRYVTESLQETVEISQKLQATVETFKVS